MLIPLLSIALGAEPPAPTAGVAAPGAGVPAFDPLPPTAAPVPVIADPTLEADGVTEVYSDWARKHKIKGPAAQLVCSPFAEGLSLCFTREQGGNRVYYTAADGKTADELLAGSRGTADAAVAGFEPVYASDFSHPYYLLTGDLRADAALLFPDALEARVGGKCVVAAPSMGVVIAWVPGDLDFDKVVAVGVKRMYDTLPNPISPTLYTWDGKHWNVWGEAREVTPAARP